MPVFKLIFKILKKHSISILIYFGVFLFLCVFLASSGADKGEKKFEATSLKVSVIDRDSSGLSEKLISYLGQNNKLVPIEDSKASMQDALYFRNAEYILIIPNGFEKRFLDDHPLPMENMKVPDSSTGYLLDNQIEEFLENTKLSLLSESTLDAAADKAIELTSLSTQTNFLNGQIRAADRPAISYYTQYLPYVLLSMLISGFSPIFLTLYQTDNRKRTTCSYTSLRSFNIQLTSALVMFSMAVWIILILFGFTIYHDALTADTIRFVLLNSFCFTLASMSIGYLIGFIAKSENAVTGLSVVAGLGMAFLGGVFVPIEVINTKIIPFSKLLPSYWYIQNNSLFFEGNSLSPSQNSQMNLGYLIQIVFALAIFTVGLLLSKKQQKKA